MKNIFFLIFLLPISALAFIKSQTVLLDELPNTQRWSTLPEKEKEKVLAKAVDPLMSMAINQSLKRWQACYKSAHKVPAKSVVKDWAWLYELNCAQKLLETDSSGVTIASTLTKIEKVKSSWITKPTAAKIHEALDATSLALAQWYDKTSRWKELKTLLQRLFNDEEHYSKQDRAKLYYYAGQVLVAERQWSEAYWQFERARELGAENVDGRIKAILPLLSASIRKQIEAKIFKESPEPTPITQIPSSDELELYEQAQGYLARGDLENAGEAMQELLKKFPLGVKAKWSQDKLFDLFTAEIEKSRGPKGESVNKKRIEKLMLELDSDRQWEWGKVLFDMQAYQEAASLLQKAAEQIEKTAKASKNYYLAARACQLAGQNNEAKKIYQKLIKFYPTAPEIVDAALQWALININENDPSEAITHLEIARSRRMNNQQDLISLYWLYHSYKLKSALPEQTQRGQELINRFPLTYYGLIAFHDQQKKTPEFQKQTKTPGRTYFSQSENMALERARALLGAGLLDEAAETLAIFSSRNLSLDESQYVANHLTQSLKYTRAFSLLSSVFDGDATRRTDILLKQVFPKEFWEYVSDDKRRSGVDPFLLLSVMKQESAFSMKAVSRSQALGLMQMIPPTAEEVKKELGVKATVPDDLFDPGTNVKFCAYYLAKLIKKYNGSIPLALAAYNAGPTRVNQMTVGRSETPEAWPGTWIDEMPLAETSFYVKSILKNYLYYKILYAGLTQLPTPPWK